MIQKPSLSLLVFTGPVVAGDFFSFVIGLLQVAALKPSLIAGSFVGVLEFFGDPFGVNDEILTIIFTLYSLQLFVSLTILCIFFSIVLASPKGSFSMPDCMIAVGVFVIESIPFIGWSPGWGAFLIYLRSRKGFRQLVKLAR